MQAPVHLLLVDPDENTRGLLRTWLGRQGFLVSTARDADHAARLLTGLDFDLIVVDQAAGALEHPGPLLRLGAGPGEVLAKPYDPPALAARINTILDRKPPPAEEAPKVLRFGAFGYDLGTGVLTRNGERLRLTSTEDKLMRALTARPNAPVTRTELAEEVGETEPGSRAVDVQITRLRRKLELDPKNPRHLQTVRGTGYVLMVE